MVAGIIWLFFLFPTLIESCCQDPGHDPEFLVSPKLTLESPTKVNVSWVRSIGHEGCIDHIFVYYWMTVGGQSNKTQKVEATGKQYVEIDLEENTVYTFLVSLFEDPGQFVDVLRTFCGITRSNEMYIRTRKSSEHYHFV